MNTRVVQFYDNGGSNKASLCSTLYFTDHFHIYYIFAYYHNHKKLIYKALLLLSYKGRKLKLKLAW